MIRMPSSFGSGTHWGQLIDIGAGRSSWGAFGCSIRFSTVHKAIVYACVNDETTLRKAGSRTDPYAIFNKRLRDGDPPDGWDGLFRKAEAAKLGQN